jgi:CRISPR system Cascade subunit CasD
MQILVMRLEAPLMAFGREMVDATGPTRCDPDASLLTGLFANALGWRRGDVARHQRLQDRLVHAARIDREGTELIDFQTARLDRSDRGWTTSGAPEGRAGGAQSYASPHLRWRHYRADASLTLAVTLTTPDEAPTVADLAAALDTPARPLFIGRKPCLPAAPLRLALIEADSLVAALDAVPAPGPARHVLTPAEAGRLPPGPREEEQRTTRRDWIAGIHAGQDIRVIVTRAGAGRGDQP